MYLPGVDRRSAALELSPADEAPGGGAPGAAGLAPLRAALRLAASPEDVMSVLVLEARSLGATSAVGYLRRGDALEFASGMGRAEDAGEWLRAVPLSAQIPVARATREGRGGWYRSRAALAAAFPGWAERVPHAARFGALAALPIRRGGVVLGAVGFAFDEERAFGPRERALLTAAVAAGARALERCRRAGAGGVEG